LGSVIAALTPLDFGEGFLIGIFLTLLPTFAQELIQGLPTVSSVTSGAVTALEDGFHNTISSVDWAALAGAVGISASSVDGAFALFTAITRNVGDAPMLDLAVSLIIDMIVFVISIVTWASHLAGVAIIALFFGAEGVYAAIKANTKPVPAVATYTQVSLVLAGIGLAAASADVLVSEL